MLLDSQEVENPKKTVLLKTLGEGKYHLIPVTAK